MFTTLNEKKKETHRRILGKCCDHLKTAPTCVLYVAVMGIYIHTVKCSFFCTRLLHSNPVPILPGRGASLGTAEGMLGKGGAGVVGVLLQPS